MKTIVKRIVAIAGLAAAFAAAPSAFASDRFPLPHEVLGIPTPHELLGIPAPHELVLGPDRYSRFRNDNRTYRDDRRYDRDDRYYDRRYYRSYDRPYYGRDWRDDRDWGYRHDHGRRRHGHHH